MTSNPSRGPATFPALLTEECKVFTSLTVARRAEILRAGLFDERFSYCEDYDLWLRMARQGSKIAYHTRILGWHRLRPDSLAAVNTRMLASAVAVLTKLENELGLEPDLRILLQRQRAVFQSQLDLEEGKQRLLAGDVREAGELLRKANLSAPTWRVRMVLLGLRVAPRWTASVVRWLRLGPKAIPWESAL